MKRLLVLLLILFALGTGRAWALTCPSAITSISPGPTSCYPLPEVSGTAITDTIDGNSGTISGGYSLNHHWRHRHYARRDCLVGHLQRGQRGNRLVARQTNSTGACSSGTIATTAGTTHCFVGCNGTNWIQFAF